MCSDKAEWFPITRKPMACEPIICLGADGIEYGNLCYSAHRGEIIYPITNQAAEPVIGPIQGWRYYEKLFSLASQSLKRLCPYP